MTPGIVSLSRTEVRHVANVVEVLVQRNGGTAEKAAAPLRVGRLTLRKFLPRPRARRLRKSAGPEALRVSRGTLGAIAAAAGGTVEQLLAGDVKLETQPMAPRVGRSRRGAIAAFAAAVGVSLEALVSKTEATPPAPTTTEQPICGACAGTGILTNIVDCEDPSCDCCGTHVCSAPCPRCAGTRS
jgi:hypothetical protein